MNILLLRWLAPVFVVLTLAVLLSGCILTGGGYYDGEGFGAAYYEPSGVEYGGWGPSYQVAPYRGGDHRQGGDYRQGDDYRPTSGRGHASAPAYRSAPASHSMPSIPSKPRSDGSRSR